MFTRDEPLRDQCLRESLQNVEGQRTHVDNKLVKDIKISVPTQAEILIYFFFPPPLNPDNPYFRTKVMSQVACPNNAHVCVGVSTTRV